MALETEVLFVNGAYLKTITPLSNAVDENWLAPAILSAQDMHVQPLLGTALYEAIKTRITSNTLTGVYLTLTDKYLRKTTAWWAMVELLPNLYVHMTYGGLVIRSSENTNSISERDLNREVERARQKAKFYAYQAHRYLCAYSSSFPEYNQYQSHQMPPEMTRYTQSGYTITGTRFPDPEYLRQFLR